MSINTDLHYLSSFGYLDQDNVMKYRKRAMLSPAETNALQTYASWTASWSNSDNLKGGFMNQGTYDLHPEAEECKWYECFTQQELADIRKFLTDYGHSEVLAEIPN